MKKAFFIFWLGFILATILAAQSIQVTSPAAGAVWPLNSTQTITWIKSGTMNDRVFIRLFKDGEPDQYISENTENDESFPWTVPGTLAVGNYTVRVRTFDRAVTGDSAIFTIGEAGEASSPPDRPSLRVLWPNGGETIEYGSSVKIRWAASNMPGASPVDISLFRGRDEVGTLAKGLRADSGAFAWAVGKIPPSKLDPGDGYLVRLRVRGTAISDGSDRPFALAARPAAGDLELLRLRCDESGNVAIDVRSTFPSLNRQVTYEIERPRWAPTRVERSTLDLDFDAPGEKTYILERILPTDLDMRGNDIIHSDYRIVLDPDNVLAEANENNNRKDAALCGHPFFPVIEAVTIGDSTAHTRNQAVTVHYGARTQPSANEVLLTISVQLRNYGYAQHAQGEVLIRQIGNQPQSTAATGSGGGTPLQYRERIVISKSALFGNQEGSRTQRVTMTSTFYMYPTDIEAEFVWEGPGAHTYMAKFRFPVEFTE